MLARQSALLASSVEDVAIAWQIFSLRHLPLDLGLVGLVLFLPQLLLALPAGMLADRFDRRTVWMISVVVEAIGLCGFASLVMLRIHALAINLAAVAFVGIAHSVGAPAQRSMLVRLVHGPRFVRAQALVNSIGTVVTIAGPAIGGALIALATPVAFGAAAAAYVVAMTALLFLPPMRAAADETSWWKGARAGLRFIFGRKIILGAISLDLFAVLFGGATALLPVYATSILHVGPTGFGALRAAPAIGAGAVAAFIARRPIGRHAGPLMVACVAGFGAATIAFGLSRSFAISLFSLALVGAFDMVSVVIRQALVQLGTPDSLRGRVSAVEGVFIGASNELGDFESGTLASFIGTQASVVFGGIATLVVIAAWAVLFPQLRKLDRLDRLEEGA